MPLPAMQMLQASQSSAAAPVRYLATTGVANSWARTADAAALDITGSFEIVMRMAPTDHTPSTNRAVVSKWPGTAGGGGYEIGWTTAGLPRVVTNTGAATTTTPSTAATGFTDGTIHWFKQTFNTSNGYCNFYTANDAATEPASWTQLGTADQGAGSALAVGANTALLYVGARADLSAVWAADIYQVIVRDGIGGSIVIQLDPSEWTTGSTWVATTGQTWTLGAAATIETV